MLAMEKYPFFLLQDLSFHDNVTVAKQSVWYFVLSFQRHIAPPNTAGKTLVSRSLKTNLNEVNV